MLFPLYPVALLHWNDGLLDLPERPEISFFPFSLYMNFEPRIAVPKIKQAVQLPSSL